MLDGSPAHSDEANIGNVENNNPISLIPSSDGVNKTRQALLKKGGRKLRSTAPLHHQKPPRSSPNIRLADHNNNNTLTAASANKPSAQPGAELPAGTQTVLTLHHLKQGAKKEVTSFCCPPICYPKNHKRRLIKPHMTSSFSSWRVKSPKSSSETSYKSRVCLKYCDLLKGHSEVSEEIFKLTI